MVVNLIYKGETMVRATVLLEKDNNDIRYFMIVDENNNGLIYDYVGGGEYQHFIHYDNKVIDDLDEWSIVPQEVINFYEKHFDIDYATLKEKFAKGAIKNFKLTIQDNGMKRYNFGEFIDEPIEVGNTLWLNNEERKKLYS